MSDAATPGDAPATPQASTVTAFYFDGKTSRRHRVRPSVDGDAATITGDVERGCPLAQLRVSERSVHATRKVSYPDGAYLEIADRAAFDALLDATGHRDGVVVRLQQSWRGALAAAAGRVAAGARAAGGDRAPARRRRAGTARQARVRAVAAAAGAAPTAVDALRTAAAAVSGHAAAPHLVPQKPHRPQRVRAAVRRHRDDR